MSASRLDAVYRSILITKFFTKGWGKPENLRRLFEFRKVVSNRDECFKLVERDYPVTITKEENFSDCRIIEGYFVSPLARHLPGIVPEVVEKAHFQAILPLHWRDPNCKPMCLHFAGTGDHFFWRRRNLMVKPLLKETGIGGIILENPFYGTRKPTDQVRSSLHNVSDIFVMGGCLILEALVLFHWCERLGLGPLGVTGLSMGGHMASLAATNWPKPLVLVPCLSWSTASAVFLQGVMSQSINWDLLEDQYLSDGMYREKLRKMVTIVDEAFLAGKKFARNYAVNYDPQKDKQTDKCKEVDVTYKESTGAKDDANTASTELPINVTSDSKNHASEVNNQTSETYTDCLTEQLKKLVEEGKLNKNLYAKLTSNQTFQLSSSDVDEINQLTEEEIKELLMKCKLADIIKPQIPAKAHIAPDAILTQIRDLEDARDVSKTDVDAENKIESPKKVWTVSDFTSDWFTNLPWIKKERKIDISKIHWRDREALQFMRGVMDECTHLSNFSVPFDTSLIIAVCALHDAYVPRDDVGTLEEIWPGADVRYVDAGHVSAYILHQSVFRSCIKEAFERSKQKWKDGKHID